MASKYSSCGVELRLYNGSTYDQIAQVTSLRGPGLKQTVIDVSDLDSCVSAKIPDMVDSGDVTVELLFDPAYNRHQDLIEALQSKTEEAFKIVWPDDSEWTFDGYVSAFEASTGKGQPLTASVTISVTGTVTVP